MKRSPASGSVLALSLAVAAAAALGACRGSTDVTAKPEVASHSGDCAACHLSEFNATTHPMHPGKKPTTCAVCHRSNTWSSSRLDHPGWPLEGAHTKANCFLCHQGTPPVFEGTSNVCDDCHRPEFDRENARNPKHLKNGIKCEGCHTPVSWKSERHPPLDEPSATPPPAITAAPATTTGKPKATVTKPAPTPAPKPVATPTVTPPPSPKAVPRPTVISGASSRR